jgi:hypothetical protein
MVASKAFSLLSMIIIIFFTNCVAMVCNLLGLTSWVMMFYVGWSQLAWNSSRLYYHPWEKKMNSDFKRALRQKWNTTSFCKTTKKKFLNNDLRKAWRQKWNTISFYKNVHKSTQWFGSKCKTT